MSAPRVVPSASGISARMVVRVVEFCERRGHDAEALCASAGVARSALTEPDARISYELAARLGERALSIVGDPDFGLHLAEDVGDARHYDAGILLLMASPTVRAALERMVELQRYWGDGERASLHDTPDGLAIRYRLAGATGEYARHSYECALAEVALGVRALSGKDLRARAVRFLHASPKSTAEHRRVFGCPAEFGVAQTEIVFDDAVLDTQMEHANAAFSAIFEKQVQHVLDRLPSTRTTAELARDAARAMLGTEACTLDGVAGALGTSARTLQRRLQEEGTSFAEVIDGLRREMALEYLKRRIPVAEIAARLGYSDATAFHHAFARWTGSTPGRFTTEARDG